jgi:hypothetical protein
VQLAKQEAVAFASFIVRGGGKPLAGQTFNAWFNKVRTFHVVRPLPRHLVLDYRCYSCTCKHYAMDRTCKHCLAYGLKTGAFTVPNDMTLRKIGRAKKTGRPKGNAPALERQDDNDSPASAPTPAPAPAPAATDQPRRSKRARRATPRAPMNGVVNSEFTHGMARLLPPGLEALAGVAGDDLEAL